MGPRKYSRLRGRPWNGHNFRGKRRRRQCRHAFHTVEIEKFFGPKLKFFFNFLSFRFFQNSKFFWFFEKNSNFCKKKQKISVPKKNSLDRLFIFQFLQYPHWVDRISDGRSSKVDPPLVPGLWNPAKIWSYARWKSPKVSIAMRRFRTISSKFRFQNWNTVNLRLTRLTLFSLHRIPP